MLLAIIGLLANIAMQTFGCAILPDGNGNVVIPSTWTSIDIKAFWNCTSLVGVTFHPDSVLASIGEKAFFGSHLTSIKIPSSVTSIGDNAFSSCPSLTNVTFARDSQMTSIGYMIFSSSGLKSVTIPSSITTIDIKAFAFCQKLSNVTFEDSSQLYKIRSEAFRNTSVERIFLPSSLTVMEDYIFKESTKLHSVLFHCNSSVRMHPKTFYDLSQFTVYATSSSSMIGTSSPTSFPSSRPSEPPNTSQPTNSNFSPPTGTPTTNPTTSTPTNAPNASPSKYPTTTSPTFPDETNVPTSSPTRDLVNIVYTLECCSAGKFSDTGGNQGFSECQGLCSAGRFGDAIGAYSLDECTGRCPVGRYSIIPGATNASVCTGECSAGRYGKFAGGSSTNSSCSGECPAGKYSVTIAASSIESCLDCDFGTYSYPVSTECILCEPGKYSNIGSATNEGACMNCPISSYQNTAGQNECIPCPGGRITPALGAISEEQCLSPGVNFITGFSVSVIILPILYGYLIHGRYHRVSFLRQQRVTNLLIKEVRAISANLHYYAQRAAAENVIGNTENYRGLRTWGFVLSMVIVGFVVMVGSFVGILGSIFFKSMILWRSIELDLAFDYDFLSTMEEAVHVLAQTVNLEILKVIFIPFELLLDFLSRFKIDLSAINVTCKGASAPVELFLNLVIIGICVIIIESNFQAFRALTFNSMTDTYLNILPQPAYRSWSFHTRGTTGYTTLKGKLLFFEVLCSTIIVKSIGGFDFFQAFMQLLMTFTNISKFTEDNWIHSSSPECNVVDGFMNYDSYIAHIVSIEAWLAFIPIIYEMSKIFLPGIPKSMNLLVNDKTDPTSSLGHVLKYTTVFSPDLMMAELASWWVRTVRDGTPNTFAKNYESKNGGNGSNILNSDNLEIGTGSVLALTTHKKASMKAFSKIRQWKKTKLDMVDVVLSKPSFRIVSRGSVSDNGLLDVGIYYTHIEYAVPIWSAYSNLRVCTNAYHLCVIDRITGEFTYARSYALISTAKNNGSNDNSEIQNRNIEHLVKDLNELHDGVNIVVIFTTGTPGISERFESGLPEAMHRCGASGDFFSKDNANAINVDPCCAYVLIGIPGVGSNGGYEIVQGGTREANIDVSFEVTLDGWSVTDIAKGAHENARCLSSTSYIFAVIKKRTVDENAQWKKYQERNLMNYDQLCRIEYGVITNCCGDNVILRLILSVPAIVLVITGLAHILTPVGRQSIVTVFFKLCNFFLICLGVWTDETVDAYEIFERVKNMSPVWDKPFLRKSEESYNAYMKNLTEDGNIAGKISAADKVSGASDDENKDITNIESREMADVQQEVLKRKLRRDYAVMMHSMVACRSVLLQSVPSLALVSIFATIMSSTPTFVLSKRLKDNLQKNIVKYPFAEARALEQDEIDEQEFIRSHLTEDEYCISNHHEIKIVDSKDRLRTELGNALSRQRMRAVLSAEAWQVQEWVVLLNGCVLYISDSRFIQYITNLYTFTITVGLVMTEKSNLGYWMISTIFFLIPGCVVNALSVIVMIGKAWKIKDSDLKYSFQYLIYIYKNLLKPCIKYCFKEVMEKRVAVTDNSEPMINMRRSGSFYSLKSTDDPSSDEDDDKEHQP